MQNKLFNANWQFERLQTPTINIGNIKIGGNNPVMVQSMANTPTHNIEASVAQAIEIFDAGASLVRFTVIDQNDAMALKIIKDKLLEAGYNKPISADIHFNATLADIAAKYADKVRVNPGNYMEKRATFKKIEFTDTEYADELKKLETRFGQFIEICKQNNTAIRIGTNHGSLSDRIMSRYGDTPAGMVEATMEFLRICKKFNFNNVVVSLKSSNTRVMVQATRLLAKQMVTENIVYTFHLGVTEAGNGNDGRIKSAVGIGALLADGVGDTIRVSLTENPANEIPVAVKLVEHFEKLNNTKPINYNNRQLINFFSYNPRKILNNNFTDFSLPIVVADMSGLMQIGPEQLVEAGFNFDNNTGKVLKTDLSPDIIYTGQNYCFYNLPHNCHCLIDWQYWDRNSNAIPLFSFDEYIEQNTKPANQNWVLMEFNMLDNKAVELLKTDDTVVIVLMSYHKNAMLEQRAFINKLIENGINLPVVLMRQYSLPVDNDFKLISAAETGQFFIDGLANGLWLKNTFSKSVNQITETAFGILQASRSRVTKTEYISCPGCGRTLFNLESTLEQIKKSTSNLKGLKIAVMGCIVNGPGEMADADYGYVGAGPGKVSLYKGKELVKRNIDTENAVNELLKIINNNKT